MFNREDLLPLILELLQPTTLPLSLCLAAGQYLGKHVSPVLYYVWQQVSTWGNMLALCCHYVWQQVSTWGNMLALCCHYVWQQVSTWGNMLALCCHYVWQQVSTWGNMLALCCHYVWQQVSTWGNMLALCCTIARDHYHNPFLPATTCITVVLLNWLV